MKVKRYLTIVRIRVSMRQRANKYRSNPSVYNHLQDGQKNISTQGKSFPLLSFMDRTSRISTEGRPRTQNGSYFKGKNEKSPTRRRRYVFFGLYVATHSGRMPTALLYSNPKKLRMFPRSFRWSSVLLLFLSRNSSGASFVSTAGREARMRDISSAMLGRISRMP